MSETEFHFSHKHTFSSTFITNLYTHSIYIPLIGINTKRQKKYFYKSNRSNEKLSEIHTHSNSILLDLSQLLFECCINKTSEWSNFINTVIIYYKYEINIIFTYIKGTATSLVFFRFALISSLDTGRKPQSNIDLRTQRNSLTLSWSLDRLHPKCVDA